MPIEPPWLTAPDALALLPGEIHVWRANLDVDAAALGRLRQTLCGDERARAARFHSCLNGDRYTAGRGMLRELLSRYLQTQPEEFVFTLNDHGKPALEPGRGAVDLRFNLSHSHDQALFAFRLGHEVGVDVERVRSSGKELRLAERFFSPQEVAALRALPSNLQPEAFFRYWTRKEAYIKARGEGLGINLASFSVSFVSDIDAHLPITGHDDPEAARWWLRPLAPGEGYAGAVCAEGTGWGLKLWQWR
jgi:4'-phosphopantetheinyl transferase